MCGIFGLIKKNLYEDNVYNLFDDLKVMLNLTSKRGGEGAGICFVNKKTFEIHKENTHVSNFVSTKQFKSKIINLLKNEFQTVSVFGQTRLPIIGDKNICDNNAPIETEELIGLHNGNIIYENLSFSNLEFSKISDSRNLFEHISEIFKNDPQNFEASLVSYLKSLSGDYNIMIYIKKNKCFYLGSNTGSLYYYENLKQKNGFLVFLSEHYFMRKFEKNSKVLPIKKDNIKNIKNRFIKIDSCFSLSEINL